MIANNILQLIDKERFLDLSINRGAYFEALGDGIYLSDYDPSRYIATIRPANPVHMVSNLIVPDLGEFEKFFKQYEEKEGWYFATLTFFSWDKTSDGVYRIWEIV